MVLFGRRNLQKSVERGSPVIAFAMGCCIAAIALVLAVAAIT